ncbi:MAG: hypothetical protein AB1416_11850 [Actinomycetota bacterium]
MSVTALAAATAAWMTGLGVPTPAVPVTPGDPTVVCHRPVEACATASAVYAAPTIDLATDPALLIHELAHVASHQVHAFPTPADLAVEEGAAEALARDLAPAWFTRFGLDDVTYVLERPGVYPAQTWWVRGLSGMACRTDWRSRCARHWRRAFVTGDRAAMIAAATAPPLLEEGR